MRPILSIVLFSFLAACGGNPCDEYVEYLCECDEENCDSLKTTYENADADIQDECSAQLDDAEEDAKTCNEGSDAAESDESEEESS